MKHIAYFPCYVPVPAKGSWIYIVSRAWEQDFHSCGKVTAVIPGEFTENCIRYQNDHFPEFSDKPMKRNAG